MTAQSLIAKNTDIFKELLDGDIGRDVYIEQVCDSSAELECPKNICKQNILYMADVRLQKYRGILFIIISSNGGFSNLLKTEDYFCTNTKESSLMLYL